MALLLCCGGACDDGESARAAVEHGQLTWQVTPPSAIFTQRDARDYCERLTLGGVKDWRLPTIDELRTLVVGCEGRQWGGACRVADPGCLEKTCYTPQSCGHCPENQGPADGCYWEPGKWRGSCTDTWLYWTSSLFDSTVDHYWVVRFQGGGLFDDGVVGFNEELGQGSVRCVR